MAEATRTRDERGQVVVIFALMVPMFLALAGAVIGIGNWYVHGKHLQTKADAGAFAGAASWGFPCASDIDANIEAEARLYAGTDAVAGLNPQVGNVADSNIHSVLNGPEWYDDDSQRSPSEFTDPLSTVCNAKILDVKVTEDNSFPLASLIPLFPDIKRKARVEIQEAEGLSGLLPIGVRIPKPASAAAVFYDEKTGVILDAKYFCEKQGGLPVPGLPVGLGGWTTLDTGVTPNPLCTSWATVNVGAKTGVVVATSVRAACGTGTPPAGQPCLTLTGAPGSQINAFCRQASGLVQCWDATGFGSTQNVLSGVQFIRGYNGTPNNGTGPPQLKSAYLDSASPAGCGAYFTSVPRTCYSRLTVTVDLGALIGTYPNVPPASPGNHPEPLKASDVEVRYQAGRTDGSSFCDYGASCNLSANGSGTGVVSFSTTAVGGLSPHVVLPAGSQNTGVAISIRVRNTTNLTGGNCANFANACRWFWNGTTIVNQNQIDSAAEIIANPVQRAFAGDTDLTGPLRWTRLTARRNCNPNDVLGVNETVEAASVPSAQNCFYMEIGLQGAIANDQDEPPLAFNLGDTGSQRAFLDCDNGAGTNLEFEIENGCSLRYAPHQFTYSPFCPNVNNPGALLGPHPSPWDTANGWPPMRCVVTQTGAGNQIMRGFNQRFFGVNNNPSCPAETTHFVHGRNYWHDVNNDYSDQEGTDLYTFAQNNPAPTRGNRLQLIDPRLITLFFTPYDSFSSTGNETFPIVGFGAFYVTGYGRTTGGGGSWQGGAPEDPCTEGNLGNQVDGLPFGYGNEPPPDLNLGKNQTWVWGHFVNPVFVTSNATPSGRICNPGGSTTPCVAVLVE